MLSTPYPCCPGSSLPELFLTLCIICCVPGVVFLKRNQTVIVLCCLCDLTQCLLVGFRAHKLLCPCFRSHLHTSHWAACLEFWNVSCYCQLLSSGNAVSFSNSSSTLVLHLLTYSYWRISLRHCYFLGMWPVLSLKILDLGPSLV